jgi:cytochrome c
MLRRSTLFAAALLALLAGCGGARGDAARGGQLFSGVATFASSDAVACNACHAVDVSAGPGIGPNLAGVATRAETRVGGQSAEEYLRTSLLNPDAYLAEGYQEGIMYRGYDAALTEEERRDLVAYLLTLK